MKKKSLASLVLFAVVAAFILDATPVHAAKVGKKLFNVKIKDANNKGAYLPDFGKKILTVIYADMQGQDMNDPVADALKSQGFPAAKVRGIGIANLKDTWAPNGVIRIAVRKKMKKYNSTILTDEDYTVPKKWGLGNCDDTSVVLIIGVDKRVKYIKKGPVRGGEIQKVVNIVKKELAAAEQAAKEPAAAPPTGESK